MCEHAPAIVHVRSVVLFFFSITVTVPRHNIVHGCIPYSGFAHNK